jgi:hypothetical protein
MRMAPVGGVGMGWTPRRAGCRFRVADLGTAAALPERRVERRRRVELALDFREFCRRNKLPWQVFSELDSQRRFVARFLPTPQLGRSMTGPLTRPHHPNRPER